jgi:NAD(P)-dependent dehydrogenase (short-subunit alcohol dehydrogenase family)
MRLKNKIAIITGAGSGFGEGMAHRFAEEGAKVVCADLNGEAAARVVPRIHAAVATYPHRAAGSYSAWPGPNSNTFVQAALNAVPELKAVLPPTAIGKDFPVAGWWGLTPSGTGVFASLGGYLGLTVGWIEGLELNFFVGVLGVDLRRPALKFPGLGRIGMPLV